MFHDHGAKIAWASNANKPERDDNMKISKTDLLLNADGSIYHLNLLPGELAETILLVGDPARAKLVSQHFDALEIQKQKREFIVHTGTIGKQRISVIGTGIGACNIEIVITEADALFNIDFSTRTAKTDLTQLRFIRLGTSGALQKNIPVDSFLVSDYAVAFDGLLNYYQLSYNENENRLLQAIHQHFSDFSMLPLPYVAQASDALHSLFNDTTCHHGITLTANGFYGPQYRHIRLPLIANNVIDCAREFQHNGMLITNFEMETAAIFGLSTLMGHQCCSLNTIVANRFTDTVSRDPAKTIQTMIEMGLEKLTQYILQ